MDLFFPFALKCEFVKEISNIKEWLGQKNDCTILNDAIDQLVFLDEKIMYFEVTCGEEEIARGITLTELELYWEGLLRAMDKDIPFICFDFIYDFEQVATVENLVDNCYLPDKYIRDKIFDICQKYGYNYLCYTFYHRTDTNICSAKFFFVGDCNENEGFEFVW